MRFFAVICLLISLYHSLSGQCDRLTMVEDYEKYFLGTQIINTTLSWNGDANNCVPGQITAQARQMTLDRINYYRRLAKLPTEVGFDDALTDMCQQAALMMHSNNELSHDPDSTWYCFSADGRLAASRSNLALGAHSSDAIALYMIDPGANNGPVGHRRWILYSRAKDFGMGSTNRAHALYVINNKIPAPESLDYVAYPGPGYFPAPLLPTRWSISVPKANFENAEVILKDEDGNDLDFEVLPVKNGYGDNTLVWEVASDAINRFSEFDQTFFTTVNNINIGGQDTSFSYTVTVAPASYPPLCKEGTTWMESQCSCQSQQTTSSKLTEFQPIAITPNPADQSLTIQLPSNAVDAADGTMTLTLYDLAGKPVLRQVVEVTALIDIQALPSGFYTAVVKRGKSNYYGKLVVKH